MPSDDGDADADANAEPEPAGGFADRWRDLLGDAEATAEEYREDGWDVLVVHPGDVAALDGEPFGLDVLAPGSEYDQLTALVEDVSFDTSHVYRADSDAFRFLIVVVEASAADVAVVVPAYVSLSDAPALAERARETGTMYTHVRPLSADARVTFTHDDPTLFF